MPDLAAAIADTSVPSPGIRVWSLGQAGFLVRSASRTVVIDPWLSDDLERQERERVRARPAPMAPEGLRDVDLVLITHEHADHLDPGTAGVVARNNPDARWVVPAPAVPLAVDAGVAEQRVVPAIADERHELGGVGVLPLPAAHAFAEDGSIGGYRFWTDADGRHRALGYLLELGGVRLLHAGDTVWWPGYEERLRELDLDAAILPINGRDAGRERDGLVGNLDGREAADLAAAAVIPLVIPCHWDGIVGNTADPGAFVRYAVDAHPALAFRFPALGEGVLVQPT